MPSQTSTPIIITATLLSAYLFGAMSSISLLAIPSLVTAPPSTTIRQFTAMYNVGPNPHLTFFTTLCFLVPAYHHRQQQRDDWKLLASAGGALFAVPAFTVLVMERTSEALMGCTDGGGGKEKKKRVNEEEVRRLVRRWGMLNMVRSVFPLLGAVVGMSVVVQS